MLGIELSLVYLKLYMQTVFSCCNLFILYLALSSNYLKGKCWNMHFKYSKNPSLCTVSFNTNQANTKNVLNFVVILHSCTLQTVIRAKGLKLGNEIFL